MAVKGAPRITEAAFQKKVIHYAKLRGWFCVHFRTAINQRGKHVTPLQGDSGSPDLLLARDGRVILIELKGDAGRIQMNQRSWGKAITGVNINPGDAHDLGSHSYILAYPKHWDALAELLK